MKKKIAAVLLAGAMAVMALAGCGGSSSQAPAPSQDTQTEKPAENAGEEVKTGYSGDVVIWVAEEVKDFTNTQVEAFKAANPEYKDMTVTIESVGEGDAASNMILDVEGGADIFGFAQDQLVRMVSAGALSPVMGDNATWVQEQNDAGAAAAAKMGDVVYAYPLTSDNGYFLYYDSSVITDPSSLEAIIADCEAAGKGVYMEINSGWYQTAFFFGNGCELSYDTDEEGKFVACNISYASEAGVEALKAMINLASSSAFVNGSSVSKAANCAAIVSGTWDSDAAQSLFGENYACAKLPTFKAGDKDVQMGGFGGFKLLGVKPQTDVDKLNACQALAKYLSSEEVQIARFEAKGWGPSNKAAQQNEAVLANEALAALADQLQYTIPQGQYPGDYWTLATSLGDSVIGGKFNSFSDEELMAELQKFQDTCISYAN